MQTFIDSHPLNSTVPGARRDDRCIYCSQNDHCEPRKEKIFFKRVKMDTRNSVIRD